GNTNLQSPDWETSVDDATHWDIVDRDDVVPIWRMLDDDLAAKVETVMNAAFELERLPMEQTYRIKNTKTQNYLSYQDFYYPDQIGKIVVAAPARSHEDNDRILWKFVPVPGKAGDPPPPKFLCYDHKFKFYIKPCSSDNDYLHASFRFNAPVTTELEGQVSLRRITQANKLHPTDEWIIKRRNEPFKDNGEDVKNIDLVMHKTAFVKRTDEFRLHCVQKSCLGAHPVPLQNIEVKIKGKKPSNLFSNWRKAVNLVPEAEAEADFGNGKKEKDKKKWQTAKLGDLDSFAHKSLEVIMLSDDVLEKNSEDVGWSVET
ncbi:hypothetical protein BC938DRAFT_482857, partial [Jimgerdemannia flammicorona]